MVNKKLVEHLQAVKSKWLITVTDYCWNGEESVVSYSKEVDYDALLREIDAFSATFEEKQGG